MLAAVLLGVSLLQVGPAAAASRAAPRAAGAGVTTLLTLTGPAQAPAGTSVRLDVTLRADDAPVAAASVTVWTYTDATAVRVAETMTSVDGTASVTAELSERADDNRFYATYAGDATYDASQSAQAEVALAPRAATTLTLDAPASARKRLEITVRTVLRSAGSGLADQTVEIERRTGGAWQRIARVRTDDSGAATLRVRTPDEPDRVRYRARFTATPSAQGSTSPEQVVVSRRQPTEVTLRGPTRLVDETSATLKVLVRTRAGEGIGRARVALEVKRRDGWARVRRVRVDTGGRAALQVRPRVDTRYRVRVDRGSYYAGGRSSVLALDNVPPGSPVVLPPGAPEPRISLPAQARAVGAGANVVVSPIPDAVWSDMQGRSWRAGCTPRAGLRLLRTNYWGFDGYRHRGELVIAASASASFTSALTGIYAARLPVRSMYRVDRFGYSSRVRGADDYASMAADNTSAFNCRDVVGRPGVRSPHSTGRSLDINPWENPYLSSGGWVPNTWWVTRSHPLVAWRSSAHLMVRTLGTAGLRWTYGTRDAHHFDA